MIRNLPSLLILKKILTINPMNNFSTVKNEIYKIRNRLQIKKKRIFCEFQYSFCKRKYENKKLIYFYLQTWSKPRWVIYLWDQRYQINLFCLEKIYLSPNSTNDKHLSTRSTLSWQRYYALTHLSFCEQSVWPPCWIASRTNHFHNLGVLWPALYN